MLSVSPATILYIYFFIYSFIYSFAPQPAALQPQPPAAGVSSCLTNCPWSPHSGHLRGLHRPSFTWPHFSQCHTAMVFPLLHGFVLLTYQERAPPKRGE
jgi:hypothetical protein